MPNPSLPADCCSVWVLGASGDLAKKKTYPSLFDLFVAELLPTKVVIVGYARSVLTDDAFRASLRNFLPKEEALKATVDAFLQLCIYRSGGYGDAEAVRRVSDEIMIVEDALLAKGSNSSDSTSDSLKANRLFYFAIPPSIFIESSASVKASAMSSRGWNRVVVEKPFGKDSESSARLGKELSRFFSEDQIYRIDHYLGKEMVQNLMVLRFANAVFEPLWDSRSISNVQITFKEPFGTEGRGGYFDEFGIIRDVMQNHLLQVFSLVAMETPVSMNAEDVRDEKVKVLKCVAPLELQDVVLGQYGRNAAGTKPSYLDDTTVPRGSVTPTFATAVLRVNNPRWKGVPFILKCGKALNERKAEIRIQFREPSNGLFGSSSHTFGVGQQRALNVHNNELVIRIQPSEAVYLKCISKMPGLEFQPAETDLSLSYQSRYPQRKVPEAYARLLLDVFRGDQSQFVRSDELKAAWAIFTPLLHRIENERIVPALYPYGSRGPPQSDRLIAQSGYQWEGRYAGEWRRGYDPDAAQKAVKALREEFSLPKERLVQIMNSFRQEMERGLAGDRAATIKMIPSFVVDLPKGNEVGSVWAIDMGGSNLRVVEVVLKGNCEVQVGREVKASISQEVMRGPAEMLFDFVADLCIQAGMNDGANVGFTFSFPVDQTGIAKGTLLEWTKGFTNPGVVGNDVVGLLQAAYIRKGLKATVSALVNDTVGTLMSAAYSDTAARIGVILGTGTNACYVERANKIPKWQGNKGGLMLINMEWGGFGSSSHSSSNQMLPFHGVDESLDAASPNEGKQRFEKMIGGMYLGELSRLLIEHLITHGAILVDESLSVPSPTSANTASANGSFAASPPSAPGSSSNSLHRKGGFTTEDMSNVAADSSSTLDKVAGVLSTKGVSRSTLEDRKLIQEMCSLVACRAARLSAMGVAAIALHMGEDAANCSSAIDGSVFKLYPNFQKWMAEALNELGVNVKLTFAEDGSGKGAALVGLVASKGV